MSKFLDGPAAGVSLMLQRAPLVLRVVQNAAGEWDALDQLADEVAEDETPYVYVIASVPSRYHVTRSPRSQSGWYAGADYKLLDPQPDAQEISDNEAWAAWCTANETRLRNTARQFMEGATQ